MRKTVLKFRIEKIKNDFSIYLVKTKVLISCAGAFVFTYAKSRFSQDTVQIISKLQLVIK